MSRPRLISPSQAAIVWRQLWNKLRKMPTVAEYAKALGVKSTRTAFRYKANAAHYQTCRWCGGRGYVMKIGKSVKNEGQ